MKKAKDFRFKMKTKIYYIKINNSKKKWTVTI